MHTDELIRVRQLLRHLSFQDKLYLLNDLTMQVISERTNNAVPPKREPLPTIHLPQWPDNLALRREDLYNDHSR